ncbi:hypothetical protein [Vibrio casei]|nr:hypothetical protein [Vibrio casei]SJN24515.1 hypothetical protein FM109_05565 [Vibrio casei]
MSNIGMDEETQESVIAMRDYENAKFAGGEQNWVVSQLALLDIESHKLIDGDDRAIMTAEEISVHRIALRDYVTNENGELKVNGERPDEISN